ncbi:MAG: hypothetical protein Q9227_005995 [Pyrenula ochraceoflavens]
MASTSSDANSTFNDFPTEPDEFDSDPRISFSKLDEKWILETEEGAEFEYISGLKRWVPAAFPHHGLQLEQDQQLQEQQGSIYKVAGVDDSESAQPQSKKRKKEQGNGEEETKAKKARVNTAIYITSIPLDADSEEIHYVFSKCGVIAEEIDSAKPRIKMYEDSSGEFKGEALVVYFRPESVDLAIQMLDDSDFRLGVTGPNGKMRVQKADYSFKKQQDAPESKSGAKGNTRDKNKIIKKTQKMNNRLADWDDDDPQALQDTSSRWDKVVILKHMFTLQELQEDPAALLDIKEDIRDECSKLGEVTNVVLFDKEPEGVASLMDGRYFDQRKLVAHIADGSEKFRKTNERKADINDQSDEDGEGTRLDEFGAWLEEKETS